MDNSSTGKQKKGSPSVSVFPGRAALGVFALAATIVLVSFLVIFSGAAETRVAVWDNLHWDASFLAAAGLAWIGVAHASPGDLTPRKWLAWGLTANALGQAFWNLLILWGQPPVPNISDLFFFLVGPCFAAGFLCSTRGREESRKWRWLLLDAAALSVAMVSITLTLYLPYKDIVSNSMLLVAVAYPVTFLSAACVGIVVVLTLKASWDRGWIVFWLALLIHGAAWMQWNALLLSGQLKDGAPVNFLFSISVLAMGVGAMIWHIRDEPGRKWAWCCRWSLRILPLFLVIVAVASVLVVKTQEKVPEHIQYAIIAGALLVIVLAMIRQSLLLSEGNRLLTAERRSKENEEKYRILFDTAQDAIFIMKEGTIFDCNQSSLRMFRGTKEQILSQAPGYFSPEIQPDGQRSFEVVKIRRAEALAGKPQFFEWKCRRLDGTEFDAEVSMNRMELLDNGFWVALVRDVTERKQDREALQMSDQKFSSAFEHAAIGMALVGVEGQWLKVNRALRQILGYSWDELKTKSFQHITHPEDLEADLAKVGQMLQGDIESYQMEKRYFHKDGRVVPVLLSVSLVRDITGKPLYFISQIQDITQKKQLEEQFLQAQKMEAMGTLAGGIAHDFNNILAAINGYSELARMEAVNHPSICRYLDSVLQAGSRAAELVRQILAFSRHQGSKRVPIKLAEVVEDALKLLRATIPSTIEFKVTLDPLVPPVLADATQVHQIMMNLGTNAWHAMKDHPGQLEIVLENYEVDQLMAQVQIHLRPGPYARLTVRDSGKGMEPGILGRIFEPFFTTKAPGEGTGLGLSVVHGIMQSHEGAVRVYSNPGEGTIFHLYFPVHHQEVNDREVQALPVPRGNGEHILFVDDEPALAELGRKVLELLGYQVKSLSSVLEAMDELQARPDFYDLVVTDQSMPKMSGVEFARQLLKIRKDLPIILTTGYATPLTVERMKEIGIRDLLLKPLCLQSLGTAVHEVLVKTKTTHGKNSGN